MTSAKTTGKSSSSSKTDGLIKRGKIWHMRFTVDGHTVAASTRTSNRREAERIKEARRTELVNQVVLGQLKLIKLHDAIELFQRSRKGMPSHANAVIQTEPFKALPNTFLDRVSIAQAMDVIQDRTFKGKSYKKSTDALTVRYFNAMVNHCAEHGYAVCKKLLGIKGVQSKIRWLTDEEEVRFFAAMDSKIVSYPRKNAKNDKHMDENSDICLLLMCTGARWQEAADITWSQVNFEKNTIHIKRGKGSNDTTLTMSDKLAQMLRKRRNADPDGDHVFPRHLGKQCAVAWFRAAVKRAKLSQVNGTVTPHTFRHTFAARLLHNGLELVEVQEMLGHKNIQSTMIYKHLQPDRAATRTAAIFNKIDSDREEVAAIKAAGVLTPEQIAGAYAGNAGQ
jgi:integrase